MDAALLVSALSSVAPLAGGLYRGEFALRSMIRGGGAGRPDRPLIIPILNIAIVATNGSVRRCLSKRFEQSAQNLRLVHICQCRRNIFAPHSEQKFGRYIGGVSGKEGCEVSATAVDEFANTRPAKFAGNKRFN